MALIPKSQREQWRAELEAATPGPWQWYGNMKTREVYLATVDRGRVFVMDFERWGMSGAQPRFQVRLDGPGSGIMRRLDEMGDLGPKMVGSHRNDFAGIGHPDATLIASAPTAISALLAENDELRRMVREMRTLASSMTGHQHWDHTMQHGAGCQLCITQREAMDRIAELAREVEE